MGTNTLSAVTTGATIAAADPNQYRTALDGALVPRSSGAPTTDGGALGSTTYMWSDLFLASGAVINFDNGDVTMTHTPNTLTWSGGNYIFDYGGTASTNFTIQSNAFATLLIKSDLDNSAAADASIRFYDGGASSFTGEIGIDGSDSNKLKIQQGSTAGFAAPAMEISGTTTTFLGTLSVDDTTDSTSTLTGSIQTDGGLGVVKRSYFGEDVIHNGFVNLGGDSELTIASGEVTATKSFHVIDTESGGATDDLVKINGGSLGDILIIRPASGNRTVVVKDGGFAGDIRLNGADFSMSNPNDMMMLLGLGLNIWVEISRSQNP